MKKLLLSLFAGTSFFAYSQKVAIGPDVGLNVMKVNASKISPNYQMGFNGGVKLFVGLTDKVSLSTGLYADQRFQTYENSSFKPLTDYSPTLAAIIDADALNINGLFLNVIEENSARVNNFYGRLPITLNLHVEKFHFSFGGYYAHLLSSRTNIETNTRVPVLETIDIGEIIGDNVIGNITSSLLPDASNFTSDFIKSKDGLNSSDAGLIVGVGYMDENAGFNINYMYGVLDYRASKSGDLVNNSTLNFTFSYLIDFKQRYNKKTVE